MEHELRTWSHNHGIDLLATFIELRAGAQNAFEELRDEIVRARIRFVVVPSFEHLATHPLLQLSMRDRLERSAGVITMIEGSSGATDPQPSSCGSGGCDHGATGRSR